MASTSEMKSKMSGLVLLSSSWDDMTGGICIMNTAKHASTVVSLEYPWPINWDRKKKQKVTSVKATKVSPSRIGMNFAVISMASGNVDRFSAGASVPCLSLGEHTVCSDMRCGCLWLWLRR